MPLDAYGAVEALNAAMLFTLAGVVYFANPSNKANRLLGPLLALDGVAHLGASLSSYAYGMGVASYFAGATGVHQLGVISTPFLYLLFLGTVRAPLTRPLRHPTAQRLLVLGLVVALTVRFTFPEPFRATADDLRFLERAMSPFYLAVGLTALYGLAAAVSAYRHAPAGTAARRRAKAYMLAFGARDAFFGLWIGIVLFMGVVLGLTDGQVDATRVGLVANWLPLMAAVTFAPILAYGLLREQLFDIDLRIKWTLRQSTVAAAFVAAFFVASELAASVLSDRIGTVAGVLAAGGLVFALAPLQRLAERVSDAAMPHVQDTEEYRTVRKREVYRAAVEAILEDGAITEKERSVLATLVDELGLSSREALQLEREARSALAAPVPPDATPSP